MYTPYNGRTIDYSKSVEVYRCLTRTGKVFSIRQAGVVVGHTDVLHPFNLTSCRFVVREASKKRCQTTNERNVHAFIVGMPTKDDRVLNGTVIEYNPYSKLGFVADGVEITSAKHVCVTANGVYGTNFL